MKKIIICIVAMFSIATVAIAQINFGAKLGFNISNLGGEIRKSHQGEMHTGGGNPLAGMLAGGYANYTCNSLFGLQAELDFSMQGGSNYDKKTVRQHYVNIPLLLEIKPFQKQSLSFLAGMQFGYCVSRIFDGTNIRYDETKNAPYKNFDFAIVCGVQYVFVEHLVLGARFNAGITPTLKSTEEYNVLMEPNYAYTVEGARNNVFQLSVGWTF
jgi:hypothetical protein